MNPLRQRTQELVAQTRQYVTDLTQSQLWIHGHEQPPVQPQSPRIVSPAAPTPVAAPIAPQAPRVRPTALKAPEPPPPNPVAEPESKTESPTKIPFHLTPSPAFAPIDLQDLKKLIGTLAPALRLVEAFPTTAITSIQHIPKGAIALILTPKHVSAEVNAFLEAVAKAVELRFGPCGILDSHALVSAKQSFPPPGPRLIPIADPMIYLREPMRKAELWNEIRRKLGKPALRP
jgi:hypothetical protein